MIRYADFTAFSIDGRQHIFLARIKIANQKCVLHMFGKTTFANISITVH